MTGKRSRSIEEWGEIGNTVKEIRRQGMRLIGTLHDIPKTVWGTHFRRISKGFTDLMSNLDERLFVECRGENTQRLTKVFYGDSTSDEIVGEQKRERVKLMEKLCGDCRHHFASLSPNESYCLKLNKKVDLRDKRCEWFEDWDKTSLGG